MNVSQFEFENKVVKLKDTKVQIVNEFLRVDYFCAFSRFSEHQRKV